MHVQTHPSAPPSDPSPSRGLYDELLRYQMANPHHTLFEDPHDGDVATNLEPIDDSERIQEARMLRQQQDEDFARSLRKDRTIERWKRCRVVVYALIELRRWRRSHLCVSVIRAIQRCEALCREMCFSTRVSQGQRNAIGAVVQRNKHIERWCRMWLEHRSHGDWDVNRLVSVQLTPTQRVHAPQ